MSTAREKREAETTRTLIVAGVVVLLPLLWLLSQVFSGSSQEVGDQCLQNQINNFTLTNGYEPNAGQVSGMVKACEEDEDGAGADANGS